MPRHEENQGRTRSYIARRAEELYPGRPDFAQNRDMYTQIVPGWLLMTNSATKLSAGFSPLPLMSQAYACAKKRTAGCFVNSSADSPLVDCVSRTS